MLDGVYTNMYVYIYIGMHAECRENDTMKYLILCIQIYHVYIVSYTFSHNRG